MNDVVLVTGCAGFIGSNFIKKFKVEFPKYKIVGIDNFSTGKRNLLDKSVDFYEGSILDEKLVNNIFKKHKPKYVFHFAALPSVEYSIKNPLETASVNTIGTVLLLQNAAKYGVRRFINSSSSSVYGDLQKLPAKEDSISNSFLSPYALQKYTSEQFCKIFSKVYSLDTVSLRYFSVFGPSQYGDNPYATVISAWLQSLYFPSKNKAFIEGDGNQTRDFCFVDNVVQANILAMKTQSKLNGVAINIAEGKQTNLLEIKKIIEKLTNKKLILEKRKARIGDIYDSFADISYAKRVLKYKPNSDLEKELKLTIDWFRKIKKT